MSGDAITLFCLNIVTYYIMGVQVFYGSGAHSVLYVVLLEHMCLCVSVVHVCCVFGCLNLCFLCL